MQLIERRIGFLFAGFLVLLAAAAGKAVWLGVVRSDALAQHAVSQQRQTVDVPARRGSILDRNGTELAVSEPAMSIAATPYLIDDPIKTADRIAPLIGGDPDELLRKLSNKKTGFVWLARQLSDKRARQVEKLEIEGLELIPEGRRVYPRDWLAAQLLGIVGTDDKGLAGLEYRHDDVLRGRPGRRALVKDALGDAIEARDERPARPGADVRLTLDAKIQDRTEEVLAKVGATYRPKGATALVMDPRDGSILALANWPRVNANNLAGAPDFAKQNRATGASYEPGSTFKAFTVAAALEEHKVTPETEIGLPAQLAIYDRIIREAHPRPAMTATVRKILEMSSNVGAVLIGRTVGRESFDRWIRRFGFGKPTGVDLPGEESGLLLDVDQYSGVTMSNLPIGQGLSVTPMQMAAAYGAIANGGMLRPPRIVEAVGGRRVPTPKGKRIISRDTSAEVANMLEGVLGPGGTASEAAIPGYHLSGKTGTAQKADAGGYSKTKYVASFAGFAPSRNPRLLVTVMVDEPQGEIYGGRIAAPAFKEITSFALQYLRIPPAE